MIMRFQLGFDLHNSQIAANSVSLLSLIYTTRGHDVVGRGMTIDDQGQAPAEGCGGQAY